MALDGTRDLFVVQRTYGANAGTYSTNVTDIANYIASTPSVHYMGQADFTAPGDAPPSPNVGDMWANSSQTVDGSFTWGNHIPNGVDVNYFDKCIWNGSAWDIFTNGSGGGGTLTGLTGEYPIDIDTTNGAEPDVRVHAAKYSDGTTYMSEFPSGANSGVVSSIATDVDIDPDDISGNAVDEAVVIASQLRQVKEDLAQATAGGVSNVTGVNPETVDIPGIWQNNADTTTYDDPAVKVYTDGTVKKVSVLFATENQVGVSYMAPAGTGASIDFTGAEQDVDANGSVGASLDNFGMMTTRRTYVNFVPRDFTQLNPLP